MWLHPRIRLLGLQSKSSHCKAPTLHIVYQNQLEGAPTPRFCSNYYKEHQLLLPSTHLTVLQRFNKIKSTISQDPEQSSALNFSYPFSLKHALFQFLHILFFLLKMYSSFLFNNVTSVYAIITSSTPADSSKFTFYSYSKMDQKIVTLQTLKAIVILIKMIHIFLSIRYTYRFVPHSINHAFHYQQ